MEQREEESSWISPSPAEKVMVDAHPRGVDVSLNVLLKGADLFRIR